tara:strand:- start:4494 stop:5129 length:636 start_codon:yes stop_codon:yes gene_type:complete
MAGFRPYIFLLTISFTLFSCGNSIHSVQRKESLAHMPSKAHNKTDKRKEKSQPLPASPKEEVKIQEDSLSYLKRKYAPLLSAAQDDIQNLSLYKLVDEWMGTPYKYGGNTQKGTDCSGFTGIIYQHVFDISLARRAADIYHKTDQKLKKEELKEGDLVFFDIGRRELSHVGVYLTNGKFVHASTSKGVVISDLEMDYYKKYFRCGGRIVNQ